MLSPVSSRQQPQSSVFRLPVSCTVRSSFFMPRIFIFSLHLIYWKAVFCTALHVFPYVYHYYKVKLKCTLVQAPRLCTGRTAHRGARPGRSLPPGKTRYPLYRRLVGPQGRSGQVRKISPPPGFDRRTVQPVASRYTNYATRPTLSLLYPRFNFRHCQ